MPRSAFFPSGTTTAGRSRCRAPASTSRSRRTCRSTSPIFRACTRRFAACWRRAAAKFTCSRPTAGRSGTTLTSYSRRSRFPLPPALNSCPRAQPSTTIAAGLIPDRPGRRRSLPSRPTRGGRKRHLRAVGCSIRAGGGISSENGFAVVAHEPMGLFYTGEELLGLRLGLAERARLARVLGSSCHLFRLVLRRLA